MRCLVTGASGYVGGRLVPELLKAGHTVRCLARNPGKLRDLPWADRVEVVRGDVTDEESVTAAMVDVDAAYYLVHALSSGGGFEETDRRAARIFARAAEGARVRRLVYLGGLTPRDVPAGELSPHLRSRAEVGDILLASHVPTAVLRAAVIIGSGSASFEMLRYLTERLPMMVTPSWVGSRVQPIAIRDVLRYLVGAADLPEDVHRAFDIGGPDVMTYRDMMRRYAEVAGLPKRLILPVPMLTPRLSSHWIGLVTPVPRALARPLAESLRYEVVCAEHDIARYVPDPPGTPLPFDEALRLALRRVQQAEVTTRWSSASLPGAPSDPLPSDPDWAGGSLYTDERERAVDASPGALWDVVEGIGGENGWYSFPLAWAVRGQLDRLVGGVGLRRGRRDARRLRVGDSLDFWRVEEIEPGRLLRLRAEMRMPGLGWLELLVDSTSGGAGEGGTSGGAGEGGGSGAEGGDPEAVLDALIERHIDFALDDRSLIVLHDRELDRLPETERKRVRQLQRRYVELWVDALRRVAPGLGEPVARASVHAVFGLLNSTPHQSGAAAPGRDEMGALLHRLARGAFASASAGAASAGEVGAAGAAGAA